MQMRAGRLVLVLAGVLALLAPALARGQALEFGTNGAWGTVKTPAYDAVVDRNGSLVVNVHDTAAFKCSLIRQWVAFQSFPQIRLMDAEKVVAADGTSVSLRFRYHWDDASVMETLRFGCGGVDIDYEFSPWQARNLGFVAGYIEPASPPKEQVHFVGLDAHPDLDRLLDVDVATTQGRERFRALSLRGAGPYTVDIIGTGDSLFTIESFPKMLLHNSGPPGTWRTTYVAGETLRISYLFFISLSDGHNLPESKVEFRE
ncbi:MAG: hypothetical protein A3K19_00755 [Lentisphaerae bacterium RIFOXYB12_FULL_65_16]|nr:MAG: hypothetical protein A3K18_14960 [Lentisphaerae bacterium RIFOXYA12_64_32]OGV86818.1 MAG: hypothetical protein A3K19_00755 [Lentisphaerae bacterium RIFOXYB12_FULL_65_16]